MQTIDDGLTNIEKEIDYQINDVNKAIEKKEKYIAKELKQSSNLYISVKEAKRINNEDIQERQESLVKEV